MIRKFRRDKIRKKVGNRNLKKAWRRFQLRKYGEDYYSICKPKKEID